MHQCISDPTHFTENSTSLLDLILVTNKRNVIDCGVGDPFLGQNIRFHCPVYGILNFSKPRYNCIVRQVWSYERGNYDLLRQKAAETNWTLFQNDDINVYANNITDHIKNIATECIPNKTIRLRLSELLL